VPFGRGWWQSTVNSEQVIALFTVKPVAGRLVLAHDTRPHDPLGTVAARADVGALRFRGLSPHALIDPRSVPRANDGFVIEGLPWIRSEALTTWDERMTLKLPREPMLTLLELCWRMKAPSGRVLECSICRTAAPGLEVRCGYGEDDLLRSQVAPEIGSARDIAEEWRQAVLAKGGVEELAPLSD
jgi:hypothetical protein